MYYRLDEHMSMLIQKLHLVYEKIQREQNIPLGDFPKLERMQEVLRNMVREKRRHLSSSCNYDRLGLH